MIAIRTRLALLAVLCLLSACYAYVPAPTSAPSPYDRAWNAALGAVQDAGVSINQADPATGMIRGTRGALDVTVIVARQGDGSARVQFDSKGDARTDPQLPDRFSQAYERRMGR